MIGNGQQEMQSDAGPAHTFFAVHLSRISPSANKKQQINQQTFSLLREELLKSADEHSTFESNSADVYNLICVVLKAGLQPFFRLDQTKNSDLEIQILDCLDIIELAIRKSPEVLLRDSNPLIDQYDVNAPLYSWVINCLVRLLLMPGHSKIHEKTCSTLTGLCVVQAKVSYLRSFDSISVLVRACADDLLCSLEALERKVGFLSSIYFPGNLAGFLECLNSLHVPLMMFSQRIELPNHLEVTNVCFNLFDIGICHLSDNFISTGPRHRKTVTWTLHCHKRLWRIILGWIAYFVRLDQEECFITVFRSASSLSRKIFFYSSMLNRARPLEIQAARSWLQCGVDLLPIVKLNRSQKFQIFLAEFLNEVIHYSRNFSILACQFNNLLRELCLALSNDQPLFLSLHQRLQHAVFELLNDKLGIAKNLPVHEQIPAIPSRVSREDLNQTGTTTSSEVVEPFGLSWHHEDYAHVILKSLFAIFNIDRTSSLSVLSSISHESMRNLSENELCRALFLIGQLSCAGARTLTVYPQINCVGPILRCCVCDRDLNNKMAIPVWYDPCFNELEALMLRIIPVIQRSLKPRIVAAYSMRSIILHHSSATVMGQVNSTFGDWCFQSLRSSIRELRIASGLLVSAFLHTRLDLNIRRHNFVLTLEHLQANIEEQTTIHESSIIALRRVAELSDDDELNIILLRLLDHLGHTNPFLSGIAYCELSNLAQHQGLNPSSLFRSFWRTLSVIIVKNLQNRPQMADQMCDLLGMKVDNLLRLTEVHILPHLVLTKRHDIIRRISNTYNEKPSVYKLCTKKNNLASILAFLLTQSFSNPNDMIMTLLNESSSEFKIHDLAGWVRTEPILIACELLRGMSDSAKGKRTKYYWALELLSSLTPGQFSRLNNERQELIPDFIEEQVLGIMTEFAHIINDFQIRQPTVEKRRNIMAIGEMIKVAKGKIGIALPQICACLRSAFDTRELCDHAFCSWETLVTSLNDDEVVPLIDQTFSIINKHWNNFNSESKSRAVNLVQYLLAHRSQLIIATYETIPSLSSIPEMGEYEAYLRELRGKMDIRDRFKAFCRRCQNENLVVAEQALKELLPELANHGEVIHRSVMDEQPDSVISSLTQSLLDCCAKFGPSSQQVLEISAECLGCIGCLDPNRTEPTNRVELKGKKDILILSNFGDANETFDFIIYFLGNVLMKAFLSASNPRAQGFLAYAMQALLKLCNLGPSMMLRSQDPLYSESYKSWMQLPEFARSTLTPFLSSKYTVTIGSINTNCEYPLFSSRLSHSDWLRTFVLDLLQRGINENVKTIFGVASRIIRGQDISIASFLLPFAALNLALCGTDAQRECLRNEIMNVLDFQPHGFHPRVKENVSLCSEDIFNVLDYFSRWLHGKRKEYTGLTAQFPRGSSDSVLDIWLSQIKNIDQLLSWIPAEIISRRAVECRSFSRALFHWEQYIRQKHTYLDEKKYHRLEPLYSRLQEIYTQIDEPDGMEGISSYLPALNIDQQILEHQKAGRWIATQNWFQSKLLKSPENGDLQESLLRCFKEAGQYDVLLNQIDCFRIAKSTFPRILPLAAEASWNTGKWNMLDKYLSMASENGVEDFNIGLGSALSALCHGERSTFSDRLIKLRLNASKSLASSPTVSLQACHGTLVQLHALAEFDILTDPSKSNNPNLFEELDRRLDLLGGCVSDKRFLLHLRRATMELSTGFNGSHLAPIWLRIAKLERKANRPEEAFNAVLRATELKDTSSTIEYARLLWKEGSHRKAIQILESAIGENAFVSHNYLCVNEVTNSFAPENQHQQNLLIARAHLLLAKWMDSSGQTQSETIVQRYHQAIRYHSKWEKAHYYLGKHYSKILDSEKLKPSGKKAQTYLSGEVSKLVIDNFLRSLAHGNKYMFQTLPKILTLWLEHASTVDQPFDPRQGDNEEFQKHSVSQRKRVLEDIHSQLRKYINRIPAPLFFTILPQVVARICHGNTMVYTILTQIVIKTAVAFPQQALWTVFAILKSSSKDRASRGMQCQQKILEAAKKTKSTFPTTDVVRVINQGRVFSEELLKLCIWPIENNKTSKLSLARHLGFNHKAAHCGLVIPFEFALTPSLPLTHDTTSQKTFRAFASSPVTVDAVLDEVEILNSLQRPRRIKLRGSDGQIYSLLCKPKDDLRKDQRLMEFNGMINRFLKRDVESGSRRLYIKTYAVTPLNEECGLIEWVDNLKTLRDLIVKPLNERGIRLNYKEILEDLDEACSHPSKLPVFTEKILAKYPPVLHEWFIETFPEPDSWFAARLRYTRSCAVMSMVGYCLGLGDRHGENILFEEETGGILHVDFNLLFDKGLTLRKPELVPFRLTHNMVDAFGTYGYNGPFRKTCEITLGLLRQNEDSLMTILETFLHDPTTDFIGSKKRTRAHPKVPETPEAVLDLVRNKLRGLLPGESVPLSVQGLVEELIIQATSIKNLAAMYVGWSPFL